MSSKYDVAVIGGGPGGYPAAIKAAQLGRSVALIEANALGGTCLNRGCIPSKALIAGAHLLRQIHRANEFGIGVENVTFDYSKMVMRKDRVVDRVRQGLEGVIKANNIDLIKGYGKLVSQNEIKVLGERGCTIVADKIIVATGSEPKEMAAFPTDGKRILDSTSILQITTLPKSLTIIGGGIIGSEFASLFAEFGVKVTILEALDRILPMESEAISNTLAASFKKRGIEISTNVFVQKIEYESDGLIISLAGGSSLKADMALVATGRKLNSDKINLAQVGVAINKEGIVEVNEKMETSVAGIYAVGDIASKWWLAHVASHQGVVAAHNACNDPMKMNYHAVPSVIFTEPEIATVGYSLEEAVKRGYHATLGAFPFQALGKSQATEETEGFAQMVFDKKTGQVLGAQVIGHGAETLIAEMGIVIANELTVECITHTIHAHPTIAEAWLEAAFIASDAPLHLPPKRQKR